MRKNNLCPDQSFKKEKTMLKKNKICLLAPVLLIASCITNAEQPVIQTENGEIQTAGSAANSAASNQNKASTPQAAPSVAPSDSQSNGIESVYTDLGDKTCQTLESTADEGGSYRGLCDGAGGYKLEVLEGDLRQTINVVAPNKKNYELNLWTIVSSGFSSVGDKAEWRVSRKNNKVAPLAFIVRFNVSENPEDSSKITSYLVISKITDKQICVTDVVKPGPDANETARQLADAAVNKPCRALPN